jgi:hypothetical protein
MAKGKKSFDDLNTENVFAEQIKEAVSEPAAEPIPRQKRGSTPTEAIVEQAREQGKTQGRKGCKAHRFNMAFSPKAYDFITTMARVRGETITSFVNHLIEQCADDNAEIYQQALKFRDSL